MKHHVGSNSYDIINRGDRFPEGNRRHRLGDRSRDRDYRDELDSRDQRWERDHEFEDNIDGVQEMVRDVLHSNSNHSRGRSIGPLDDFQQGLGSSWLEIERFFSGTSGYHRACKFIKFMKMLESQN